MLRPLFIIIAIFSSMFFVQAEQISLSGTVKKSGTSAAIAGVTISLAKFNTITTTTDPNGAFTLTGVTTSVFSPAKQAASMQFIIKDNSIVFSPGFHQLTGSVEIFSSNGKKRVSVRFNDLPADKQIVTLPKLDPGMNIMRVSIGAKSFTRTLICIGNERLLKNEAIGANADVHFALAKHLAETIVDTLVAEKSGYKIQKLPLDAYTKQDIAFVLDTSGSIEPEKCTRESMKAITDKYLDAQKAGDPTKMPLASEVKYIQNNKTSTAEKIICKTAMPIDFSRSFFDVDSCRSFTEVISNSGGTPWVIVTWLKIAGGNITEISTMVTTTGDWLFNAANYLKYSKQEDWHVLTASEQSSRQTLINGGNAYLDIFADQSVDTVPWGRPCARLEGGSYTGDGANSSCNVGIPSGSLKITNRRYAVDVDMGTVCIFCAFGGSMPDSHMFRMVNGKLRYVHTLSVNNKL